VRQEPGLSRRARRGEGSLTGGLDALAAPGVLRHAAAVRSLLLASLLLAPIVAAQPEPDEFSLPVFAAPDAGVVSTSASPPVDLTPPPPPPPPSLAPPPSPTSGKPPPPTARWNRLTGSLTGVLSGLVDYYAGVELFGGVVFGAPTADGPGPEVGGWVVVPGLELLWARLSGPVCAGSDFCGQRWVGGGGVRAGHASGVPRADGVVRVRRFYFGELSAQVAYVVVPSAPLTGGSTWAEGVFRLRGGVQLNASTSQRAQLEGNGVVLHLSGFVEALAFNPLRRTVQLGVAAGLGF